MTPDAPRPDDRTGTGSAAAPSATHALFRTALRQVLVFLAALAVVSILVGVLVRGVPGLWGALLGVGVAILFSGTTVWSMWRTADAAPTTTAAVVLGSWTVKIILVIVVLVVLKGRTFYDTGVFVVTLLVGVLGSVVLDYLAVRGSRVPYVDAAPGPDGRRDAPDA